MISEEALTALKVVGLYLINGEMYIPSENVQKLEDGYVLQGVRIVREQLHFDGYEPPPSVFSTLEGGMVPTGRSMEQCSLCRFWLSDKPSPQDERRHNDQCGPRYRYILWSGNNTPDHT